MAGWFCGRGGSFFIRFRTNKSKNPSISTNFKLTVASTHAQTGGSLEPIMSLIASFFGVTLYLTKDSTYRVDVASKVGFVSVINYFTKYPLFTYKFFNFIACVKVHNMLVAKTHLTPEGQTIVLNIMKELTEDFNEFDWSHLDGLDDLL